MEKEKVMVTGNKGYIGSNLVKLLETMNYEIIGYDIVDGKDILNRKQLAEHMEGCSFVFNCAAIAGKAECKADPVHSHNVNVNGVKNVVEIAEGCCEQYSVKPILFSSFAVLGDTTYGEQKRKVEEYKDRAVILRPSNIFGGDNFSDKKPNNFIVKLIAEDPIVFRDIGQTRDFVHVDKVLEKCLLAIHLPYGVYDVCTGHEVLKETIALLASTIRKVKMEYDRE